MCCFSRCCLCFLLLCSAFSAAYSYLNIMVQLGFFWVAHETRLRSFRFLLGSSLPHLFQPYCIFVVLFFAFHVELKRACSYCIMEVAFNLWNPSFGHFCFSEFQFLFFLYCHPSLLHPLCLSLSLSLSNLLSPSHIVLLSSFCTLKNYYSLSLSLSLSLRKWAALKIAFSITEIDTYSFLCSLFFWFQA